MQAIYGECVDICVYMYVQYYIYVHILHDKSIVGIFLKKNSL